MKNTKRQLQSPAEPSLPLLNNCTLTLAGGASSALAALQQSLLMQSRQFGIGLSEQLSDSKVTGIQLAFQTHQTAPVRALVTPWHKQHQAPASENIIQAACGLMSVHGRAQGEPQALPLPYISCLTASLALQGVFAASLAQLRGHAITDCNISMMAAGLLGIGQYIAGATAPDGAEKILPQQFSPLDHPPFLSADGVEFELETLAAEPWRQFWQAAGVPGEIAGKAWGKFLMRYAKAVAPLPPELPSALARLPYTEILRRCNDSGVAICPLHQGNGDAKQLVAINHSSAWHFSDRTRPPKGPHPAPLTGSLPLSGVVVVEACRRIQGPLAGHLLALLGARLIRIEPPGGDPLRGMSPLHDGVSTRFDALNHLKEVVEIDIKSASGQQQIKELVCGADVFLHNWAPGKAAQYSLDAADMRSCNPHLIYAYAGGWGPLDATTRLPGTDFMVQAFSGLAADIGVRSRKLGGSLFTVLDVFGGMLSSQGVVAALLARQLSGEHVRVDSSLLGAANLLSHVAAATEKPEAENPLFNTINKVYATADGWIAVDCINEKNSSEFLAHLDGFRSATSASQQISAEHLSNIFLQQNSSEWLSHFKDTTFVVAKVIVDLTELIEQPESQHCLSHHQRSYARVNPPWIMRRAV